MTDLAFPGTSIPGYRIKLVFLFASAVYIYLYSIRVRWKEVEGGRAQIYETRNSKALYGVNVRITFVPAAYHEALKRRCSFPIPIPISAHPSPSHKWLVQWDFLQLFLGVAADWPCNFSAAEGGSRRVLQNWTDSNFIWAMGWAGLNLRSNSSQSRVMKRCNVKENESKREMCIRYSCV